jgi:hypothetical protein
MTQAAQLLPARLPPSLVPTLIPSPAALAAHMLTPNTTPVTSVAPTYPNSETQSSNCDDPGVPASRNSTSTVPEVDRHPQLDNSSNNNSVAEDSPIAEPQCYHIKVPPPLPHMVSCQALCEENMSLRAIIKQVGIELEQDYAQMKLMDLENERLCQKAFTKEKQKAARKKLTLDQACHMTAPEMIDHLARQTW